MSDDFGDPLSYWLASKYNLSNTLVTKYNCSFKVPLVNTLYTFERSMQTFKSTVIDYLNASSKLKNYMLIHWFFNLKSSKKSFGFLSFVPENLQVSFFL